MENVKISYAMKKYSLAEISYLNFDELCVFLGEIMFSVSLIQCRSAEKSPIYYDFWAVKSILY